MSALHAILMAGGSGTRFWPASRAARPKQLLPIGTERPLIVETSARLGDTIPPERQWVITSRRYVDDVRALLPDVPPEQVVGEPLGRDTAPCIGLAGQLVGRRDPDAVAVAMPSDHVIGPVPLFLEHLQAAAEALAAHPGSLLVFGIQPDHPATGYGYLRQGERLGGFGGHDVHRLQAFVEKPDRQRAEVLLAGGDHLWNAGLFAFRPAALEAAYATHLPDMLPGLRRLADAWSTDVDGRSGGSAGAGFEAELDAVFPTLEKVSIDFGVMEQLEGTLLLPLPVRWDDVGAWTALAALKEADERGNVIDGDALLLEAGGCIVSASEGSVVTVKGVDDLIVVHTPDATMVCRRDDDQGVKAIVQALRERGWERYL